MRRFHEINNFYSLLLKDGKLHFFSLGQAGHNLVVESWCVKSLSFMRGI